jgi:hypothetical protein
MRSSCQVHDYALVDIEGYRSRIVSYGKWYSIMNKWGIGKPMEHISKSW